MSCKIYTLSLNGLKREICVNSEEELKNMTVKEFVRRFCPEEDDLDFCRYIFCGKRLEADQTFGSYGIKHGSTIYICLRLRGGGPPRPRPPPEDEGMSRTESMEILAIMQQTEPECCIL